MDNNKTWIDIVLDRSGSMASTKTDAEGGFNAFIKAQKDVPGACVVSLHQFNTEYETVYSQRPIKRVPHLHLEPSGGTALLNAIGLTIDNTGNTLAALPEDERPGKVIMVVVTDGFENSSHLREPAYTAAMVRERVQRQRTIYNWQFVFLGATETGIVDALTWGFDQRSTAIFAANAIGTQTSYAATTASIARYRVGETAYIGYTNAERDAMK